jgi:hypothetical protein
MNAGTIPSTGPKYGMILHIPANTPMNTPNSRPRMDKPMEDRIATNTASSIAPLMNNEITSSTSFRVLLIVVAFFSGRIRFRNFFHTLMKTSLSFSR